MTLKTLAKPWQISPASFWLTPGSRISVEGYTDSVGSDAYNLTLSQNRANVVKAYLIEQGLGPA